MHLGRVVELFGGQHELPDVAERDLRDSLLELRPLRSPHDVELLTALVYQRARGSAQLEAEDGADVPDAGAESAHALHVALGEVGDNVCQHAANIGFMAAQTIAEHGVLRFAVADAGVGLRATLAGIGAADDHSALALALSGERGRRHPGHGYGLPRTVRSITELDGELLLASGTAAVRIDRTRRRGRTLDVAFRGTIFEGSVPATAPRRDEPPRHGSVPGKSGRLAAPSPG